MPRRNPCSTLTHQFSKITNAIYSAFGFFVTNPRWTAQAGLLSTALVYEANRTYIDLIESESDIYYAIARSGGAALKLLTLSTLVPLNRVFYTKIQTSELGKYFGLDRRIADHKLFGFCMIYVSLMHAIAHYLYNPENYGKQSGISGMLMLGSLLIPIAGIFSIREQMKPCATGSWGTLVLGTHRAGAAIFGVIYVFHTADLRMLNYVAAAACSLGIDRIVEYRYFKHTTHIKQAKLISDTDFISIVLQKPSRFKKYHPGQHAFLSFPAIDGFFELPHPFTIVRCDNNEIEFIIKKIGRWTMKLSHFVENLNEATQSNILRAIVIGPFGDALVNHTSKNSLTMIGTGVGLTPTLSVLNGILNNQIQSNNLHLHISQKKLSELIPFVDALAKVNNQNPQAIKSVDLYLTDQRLNDQAISNHLNEMREETNLDFLLAPRANASAMPTANLNVFSLFSRKNKSRDDAEPIQVNSIDISRKRSLKNHLKVNVHLQRPDLPAIVANSQTVNVCGGQQVSNQVMNLSRRLGRKCTTESF